MRRSGRYAAAQRSLYLRVSRQFYAACPFPRQEVSHGDHQSKEVLLWLAGKRKQSVNADGTLFLRI